MVIGLIGAGNMGSALARGLGEPLLVFDVDGDRARDLAAELDGEAVSAPGELAERADVVVLAHKPGGLDDVARRLGGTPRAVASILGGVPLAALERAYPGVPVYRFMPNLAVEVRRGVVCYAVGSLREGPEGELFELIGRLGVAIELHEALMEPATALAGCGPAFFALVVEALADAGVRHGLAPAEATRMAREAMGGAADLLAARGESPEDLRRRVTSPGGSTARGLAALERGAVRSAFADAVDAVVAPAGGAAR